MSNNQIKKPTPNAKSSNLKSFISGGAGGICLVLAGHPLDLVKVKVQTGHQSTFNCLNQVIRKDGLKGLYRGVFPPLMGVAPIMATTFWGYNLGQNLSRWYYSQKETEPLSLGQTVFAGGFSAIPAVVLVAPGERIKCLMQVSEAQGKAKLGMMEVAKQVYSQGGVKALYKGTMITLIRDIPGSMAYFAVYESLKRTLNSQTPNQPPSMSSVMMAGGIAGMVNWMISIPADVLKSRLQTAPAGQYKGMADVYRKLVASEGYLGLYRGLTPALLRAFPANAACFLGVEMSLTAMNKLF